MNLHFSPDGNKPEQPVLTVAGDIITANGEAHDFSDIPNGATLPRSAITSEWILGPVERDENGVLTVYGVVLPHGPNAPKATRFPAPLENVADGPVALPIYDAEETPA